MGRPKLDNSRINLLVADQPSIAGLDPTDYIPFKLAAGAVMWTRFYVIPTKGRDQATLGREFVRDYPLYFNIYNGEQTVTVPDQLIHEQDRRIEKKGEGLRVHKTEGSHSTGQVKTSQRSSQETKEKDLICVLPLNESRRPFLAGRTIISDAKESIILIIYLSW